MSNILTDILGLDSQKKYKENPLAARDVFVIGDVDVPRMVGISSPIPIKDEKLVTFYDLALSVIGLLRIENVGPGAELVIPPAQTGNPFLWNVRTLTSQDGTVSIVEGGDTVDFAAIFSTDVHPIDFTYNQTTHELTIEQNSAPGPIQFLTVDLDNLALEILDEGVSIDTNVTQIDFVGEGIEASLDSGKIVVEVNQPALQIQEEGGLVPPGGSTALTTINFIGDAITATTGAAGAVNVTVNSPVTIEDEGSVINTAPLTIIDFVGDGVTTIETSAGEIQVSIPQGQFDIEEEGAVISTAAITSIDFVGDSITASETAPGEIQVEVIEDQFNVEEEGVVVNSAPITVIDFVGDGVTATETTPGQIQVDVPQYTLTVGNPTPVDTDVNEIQFTGDGVTVTPVSAGVVEVNVEQPGIDIEEEGVIVNTAPVTSIDFVGSEVTATETAPGQIQVTVEAEEQEELTTLISNNVYFVANRVDGSYSLLPPVQLSSTQYIFRFGGVSAIPNIYSSFSTNWTASAPDVILLTTAPTAGTLAAKEDQINLAIPLTEDLLSTDKIRVTGTCFVPQSNVFGSAKMKVAIGKGTCSSGTSFTLLNDWTQEFTGVGESATGSRIGATYQRICFTVEVLVGGDGLSVGSGHIFVGFNFGPVAALFPSTGDYAEYINVNYNVVAIKNPS